MKKSVFLVSSVILLFILVSISVYGGSEPGDKLQFYGSILGSISSVLIAIYIFRGEIKATENKKIADQNIIYLNGLKSVRGFMKDMDKEFETRLNFSTVDNHLDILNECGIMYSDLIMNELNHLTNSCTDIDTNDKLFNFIINGVVFRSKQIKHFMNDGDFDNAKASMAYLSHHVNMLINGCENDGEYHMVSFKDGAFVQCNGKGKIHDWSKSLDKEITKIAKKNRLSA